MEIWITIIMVLTTMGSVSSCSGEAAPGVDGGGGASGGALVTSSSSTSSTSSTTNTSSSTTTEDGGAGSGGMGGTTETGGSGGMGGMPDPLPVGASCLTDTQCASNHCVQYPDPSMGSYCSGMLPIGAECDGAEACESYRCTILPDNPEGAVGICTRTPCGNDDNCGPGGVCVHEDGWWCRRACASDSDCYQPFTCLPSGTCGVTVPTTP